MSIPKKNSLYIFYVLFNLWSDSKCFSPVKFPSLLWCKLIFVVSQTIPYSLVLFLDFKKRLDPFHHIYQRETFASLHSPQHFSRHWKVFGKATKNIINMKRRANLYFCGASDNISINYAVLSLLSRRSHACVCVLENSEFRQNRNSGAPLHEKEWENKA